MYSSQVPGSHSSRRFPNANQRRQSFSWTRARFVLDTTMSNITEPELFLKSQLRDDLFDASLVKTSRTACLESCANKCDLYLSVSNGSQKATIVMLCEIKVLSNWWFNPCPAMQSDSRLATNSAQLALLVGHIPKPSYPASHCP
jgi:hypothetical protein